MARVFSLKTIVVALALFSLFFGAGNLILPPYLGFQAGESYPLVILGFFLSAVLIPIFGIVAHARLQGTMYDFAVKVSPTFSLVYCILIYAISISLPSPRTASVTHEMAIAPVFNSSAVLTSTVYFALVFVFVLNRSKILDLIGKWLTPIILAILVLLISLVIAAPEYAIGVSRIDNPFSTGLLEGYQTFDAIGAVVVGGVIIISIQLKEKKESFEAKRKRIAYAGWLAGLGLLAVYSGLIIAGALMQSQFGENISRTGLLSAIGKDILGHYTNIFLSVLISLACFTTAVGIVTGAADFAKSRFENSTLVYRMVALLGCVLGIVVGQLNVDYIIVAAIPALMFIYPVTIALIFLNVLPTQYATPAVFRVVILTTMIFSIPDFLGSIGWTEVATELNSVIPLGQYQLGWVLPAVVAFLITNSHHLSRKGQIG